MALTGLPGTPQLRRRIRTGVLGVVAFVALLWGAIDIVGVPAENLWRLLGGIVIGVLGVIVLAGALVALWQGLRRVLSRRD